MDVKGFSIKDFREKIIGYGVIFYESATKKAYAIKRHALGTVFETPVFLMGEYERDDLSNMFPTVFIFDDYSSMSMLTDTEQKALAIASFNANNILIENIRLDGKTPSSEEWESIRPSHFDEIWIEPSGSSIIKIPYKSPSVKECGESTTIMDLYKYMDQGEEAKQILRDLGFGVTGTNLLETVKEAAEEIFYLRFDNTEEV